MARKIVYMIRHGKTKGNEAKRYIGNRTDEPLSEAGRAGAKALSQRRDAVFWETPDRICTSPMLRAVETAKLLFDDPALTIIEELTEMDFGMFEGKNHEQLKDNPLYRSWIEREGRGQIPEGEDFTAFRDRSVAGFQKALGQKECAETIAVVCHGGTIMAVLHALTGKAYYSFMAENLSGYRLELEYDDAGLDLIAYGSLGAFDHP